MTAQPAYQSTIEPLNGLWEPFGKKASRFLATFGNKVVPDRGLTDPEEEQRIWDSM